MISCRKRILMVFLVLSLNACGYYSVTFDSNPQGAILICNGQHYGYTPAKLSYDIDDQYEFLDLSSCTANWISGAQYRYDTVPIKQFPHGVRITAPRPSVPGYAEDAGFALQIQQLEYQKRQAEALENQAYQQNLINNQLNQINNNINNTNNLNNIKDFNNRLHNYNNQSNQWWK